MLYCRIFLTLLAIGATGAGSLAADRVCAQCHAKEVAGYQKSAMARSLSLPASLLADQPAGSFVHAVSGTRFSVENEAGAQIQTYQRVGESDRQRVAFVIGSGDHAFGYLVQVGDHLFQSPLSYYTTKKLWDVAPGYEDAQAPDFSRPVTLECVLCHAGAPRPRADTLNSYESPAFAAEGITCERCHGPTEAHLKSPGPGTISNPAKMTGAGRDSVCEQCHLAGEIRIPNPGKTMADFRVGEPLENTFTVYVAAQKPGAAIKVVSHAEQLAASACARNSGGRLWCGTCHDPHAEPANPVAYYREKCLACHAATLMPAHQSADRDCVACHMGKSQARDGGHTAFTDHRIRRETTRDAETAVLSTPEDLAAWREPEPQWRDRNRAIALVTDGMEHQAAGEVIRGYKLMNRVAPQFPHDAPLLTSLGSVLLKAKQPAEALRRFQDAQKQRPAYAPYGVNVAAALIELGRTGEAAAELEKTVALDPLLFSAVRLLAAVYRTEGRDQDAANVMRRCREAMEIRESPGPGSGSAHASGAGRIP